MGERRLLETPAVSPMSTYVQYTLQSTFAPEAELLLLATRTDGKGAERLAELIDDSLDWSKIVEQASAHGIGTLVYQSLGPYSGVPDAVREELNARSQRTATQNLRYTQELVSVLEALTEAGIDAIPYRGPMIAMDAYGQVGLREFGDLDFLLRQTDIPAAKAVLEDRGYDPQYLLPETTGLNRTQEWAYTHLDRDYPFYNPDTKTAIELHWRILDQQFPTDIRLGELWDRRATTTVMGREIPVLSPEDRLLMLCIHGSRHHWERLEWICDVVGFIGRHEIDWEELLVRARRNNAERLFLLGPLLAHQLYGTQLPGVVHRAIWEDRALNGLARAVTNRLFDGKPLGDIELQRFQARTLTRRRDQLRLLGFWMVKPRRAELETVALPFVLIWVYFLIRPVRLLGILFGIVDVPDE